MHREKKAESGEQNQAHITLHHKLYRDTCVETKTLREQLKCIFQQTESQS